MFLGDGAPIIVKDKLLSIGYSSEKPIKVDLIKLTHHGSKFNICNELIEMIVCDNFIISSNDRNFSKKLYQGYL
jgi:beta-lactamase superfamily II metal-dependent hydrolase